MRMEGRGGGLGAITLIEGRGGVAGRPYWKAITIIEDSGELGE